jgi:sRNA-binding protein
LFLGADVSATIEEGIKKARAMGVARRGILMRRTDHHDREITTEVISHLAEAYPNCFAVYCHRRRPLKIGILADLVMLVPFAEDLRAAIRYYTGNEVYLRACDENAPRISLEGHETGRVSAAEAAYAQRALAKQKAAARACAFQVNYARLPVTG